MPVEPYELSSVQYKVESLEHRVARIEKRERERTALLERVLYTAYLVAIAAFVSALITVLIVMAVRGH